MNQETINNINKFLENNQLTTSTAVQNFKTEISQYLEEAKEKHQAILDLYGLAAGDSVAGGYLQNANDEKKQANFWRWATITFIIATVIWTAISYFTLGKSDGGFWWSQLIKGFSITAVLLFGAGYSSKQSSIHRHNEKQTRRFALEVKAIDPFIASLNEENQSQLKHKLSEKLFGQNNNDDSDNEGRNISENSLKTLSKLVIDILKANK